MLIDPATESNLIIALVCVPLLVLLVGGLVLRRRFARNRVDFPDFSVSVRTIGREEALVTYVDVTRKTEFDAGLFGGKQIALEIPKKFSDEEVATMVPKLSQALKSLRFEYFIYKSGETEEVGEAERNAAISELQRMGFEIQVVPGLGVVKVKANRAGPQSSHQRFPPIPDWMRLIRTASGRRPNHIILACSDPAADVL